MRTASSAVTIYELIVLSQYLLFEINRGITEAVKCAVEQKKLKFAPTLINI
jgi:hypothetical protein